MSDTPAENASPASQPESASLKEIEKYMVASLRNKASDFHLKAWQKPFLRVNTVLHDVGNRMLSPDDTKRMIYEIMSEEQRERFEKLRVVQVPVTYTPRSKGQGKKLRASASLDVLRAILRVRFGG